MKHTWHFTINQFLVATRNNYKKALTLSIEHDLRQKSCMENNPGDPDYVLAYNRYHPLHEALQMAYVQWKSQGGMQKGDTLSVRQLLKLLPGKINTIDRKIQDVHEKGSARYKQLFPHYHKPFYRGSIDERISAVNALSKTMGDEPALAALKIMADNAYDALLASKAEQTGAKSITSVKSSQMETARINAMVCQYQNVGFYINKFPTQPERIESLFDVSTLTNPEQVIWRGQLDAGEIHPLMVHTFYPGDIIRIKGIGPADIKAYLASTPGGTDSIAVLITANHSLKFDVTKFEVSDHAVHRYLTLVNTSETDDTRFFVQLY